MNIYEKMQNMRCELQHIKLKKSGKNAFANYEYFELQDITPAINHLMQGFKVTSEISFGVPLATLKIINSEKTDEVMTFTCPMAKAVLKGCHEVQNLGASITYIRRYLYINAFEIVEHDALDSMPLNNKPPEYISKEQVKQIKDLALELKADPELFLTYMEVESVEKILKTDYQKAITSMEIKREQNKKEKE